MEPPRPNDPNREECLKRAEELAKEIGVDPSKVFLGPIDGYIIPVNGSQPCFLEFPDGSVVIPIFSSKEAFARGFFPVEVAAGDLGGTPALSVTASETPVAPFTKLSQINNQEEFLASIPKEYRIVIDIYQIPGAEKFTWRELQRD
jgi:hypothetical protein